MGDHDHPAANCLDALLDHCGIVVQAETWSPSIGHTGQIDGVHLPAARCQLRPHFLPAPRAKPGAVH